MTSARITEKEGDLMSSVTPSPARFPQEVLEQPIVLRHKYFENKMVAHRCLTQAHTQLLQALRYPAGASLIFVVGPTGVGKTTLRSRIERQLIADAQADPTTTPGHIPVIGMEIPSPETGNFSWKDYYTRALLAVDEPMLSDKIAYGVRGMHRDSQERLVIERNITALDLRRVFEKCLLHRHPRAFLVDEAQHFKKMSSGRRLLDQMDHLKSLANLTSTVHVFFGTYDLIGLMNLSAQLARRSVKIHLPRYCADKPEDREEFKKVLRTFQRHLPLAEEPDLEGRCDYFYERSLGLIGLLKDWLTKALAAALEANEPTLTEPRCERHAHDRGTLEYVMEEIKKGEQALQRMEQGSGKLRKLLQIDAASPPATGSGETQEPGSPGTSPPPAVFKPRKSKGSRVGQRTPNRDRTGRETPHAG